MQAVLSEVLVRVTFWICAAYPLTGLFWPWWKSSIGVTVVAEAEAIALLLLPAELHYLFGLHNNTPGWEWFALACFAAVPVTLTWRAWAIYQAQKRGEQELAKETSP